MRSIMLLMSILVVPAAVAGVVAVDAERGKLGGGFVVVDDDEALDGRYVTSGKLTGDRPVSSEQVATYKVELAQGRYDLFMRIRVDSENPQAVDSVFLPAKFGEMSLDDNNAWLKINELQDGANSYVNAVGEEIKNGVWSWVRFSGQVDKDVAVPPYVSPGGEVTFQIGHREELHIDALAWVPSGQKINSEELDSALALKSDTDAPLDEEEDQAEIDESDSPGDVVSATTGVRPSDAQAEPSPPQGLSVILGFGDWAMTVEKGE
ncbi:hypothetical protein HW115_13715 [Verrucomicrobiaceae bacterium N1E253]|uniref:Uncharacterized protein n=1 Tax=Oceaniferula marina TaxID=2748318 RepID=A0A851GNG6_9BACT|nr:hypothetical protein [Oceaniferula marina]NWK56675.1 hypothetical protein [Oceaniferula marina]